MMEHALHKSERRYADYTFFSGIVCTQAIVGTVLERFSSIGVTESE